jgi:hypothetical protein
MYIPGTGLIYLLEMAVKKTRKLRGWKVFQCVQGNVVVAEVAGQKEWCKIDKRHPRLFGVSLPFLSSTRNSHTHLGWI